MMLILAYDSYFEKKDSQVILVKKCPKDSQHLRIMILIKKMSVVLFDCLGLVCMKEGVTSFIIFVANTLQA